MERRDILFAHSVDVSAESEQDFGSFDVPELTGRVQRSPALSGSLHVNGFWFGLVRWQRGGRRYRF